MPADSLSIGFIGGAHDSAVGCTHRIAAQMDGRWKLAAGCFSEAQASNEATGKSWLDDHRRLYRHWQTLLEQEQGRLDAIAVLTPTPSHSEIVLAAIAAGYAVICEKALAAGSLEAKKIKQAVEQADGFLAVPYNYSGYPMLRELKLIIASGELGNLHQVQIEMPSEGFLKCQNGEPIAPQEWRLQDAGIPTLALDLGTHVHHIIKFLTEQKPLSVVACTNTFGFFEHIIDNTLCIARYSNNIDCQIWFSKSALGHSNGLRVRVYGNQGAAEWHQMEPEHLFLADNRGQKSTVTRASDRLRLAGLPRYNRFKAGHPAGFIEAFANCYYDLADARKQHQQGGSSSADWCFGVDDALEGLLMLEAMSASARLKNWQDIGQ